MAGGNSDYRDGDTAQDDDRFPVDEKLDDDAAHEEEQGTAYNLVKARLLRDGASAARVAGVRTPQEFLERGR